MWKKGLTLFLLLFLYLSDRYRGGCFCRFYDNESIAGVRCCGSNVICYPVHDAAPLFSVPSSAYVML